MKALSWRRMAVVAALMVLGAVLSVALLLMPEPGVIDHPAHNETARRYLSGIPRDTNTPNIVNAIVTDYRAIDTLGEATVLFVSIIAVGTVLHTGRRRLAAPQRPVSAHADRVLSLAARLVIPFVIVYGAYVTVYGHISPGGGFPGGALLAAALILGTLTFGRGGIPGRAGEGHSSEWFESGALLLYLTVGSIGVWGGGAFLSNLSTGVPAGVWGTVLSGGFIPLIGIAIGVKVAATMVKLFETMDAPDEGSTE